MQQSPLLRGSDGHLYRHTPNGTERIPQPFHYRFFAWLIHAASTVRW